MKQPGVFEVWIFPISTWGMIDVPTPAVRAIRRGGRNCCRIFRPIGVQSGIRSKGGVASCLRLGNFFLEILVNDMLQVFGDLEDRNIMLVDHDLFSGSRVPGHPALTLLHFEASESADLDVPSGFQGIDDGGDEAIHHRLCFHLGQPCGRRDNVNYVCFSQAASRKIEN